MGIQKKSLCVALFCSFILTVLSGVLFAAINDIPSPSSTSGVENKSSDNRRHDEKIFTPAVLLQQFGNYQAIANVVPSEGQWKGEFSDFESFDKVLPGVLSQKEFISLKSDKVLGEGKISYQIKGDYTLLKSEASKRVFIVGKGISYLKSSDSKNKGVYYVLTDNLVDKKVEVFTSRELPQKLSSMTARSKVGNVKLALVDDVRKSLEVQSPESKIIAIATQEGYVLISKINSVYIPKDTTGVFAAPQVHILMGLEYSTSYTVGTGVRSEDKTEIVPNVKEKSQFSEKRFCDTVIRKYESGDIKDFKRELSSLPYDQRVQVENEFVGRLHNQNQLNSQEDTLAYIDTLQNLYSITATYNSEKK